MRSSSKRFSSKVREYLTMKFKIGQETGRKQDPAEVAKDMRAASTVDAELSECFTERNGAHEVCIQSFVSRLSRKTKEDQVVMTEDVENGSEDDYLEEYACHEDESCIAVWPK
ncbi:Hypothetical predicted protein [Paramuricea clavata]|uniref:Uncharacterized protein n=1 Tax=Paramuricea clavata TaxID=317549 RepID=A0A7D9EG15_PARCT|nr:Hypothetical predicted protein [Paramuricea clavata]